VISYLGKISYGLYVYHWLVSYYIIYLINSKFGEVNYFIYLLGSMLGTVLVASFSYEILEKRFLKFKSKFALIKSGKV
jgi:peptidoglycan/LPS O-acetylase OafA/YrhL